MLVNDLRVLRGDPILDLIGGLSNRGNVKKQIATGIYQISHFGSSHYLPGYESWIPDLSINSYGVCDNYQQILEQCPKLEHSDRKFLITLTPIVKADQPSEGGWRWCKWGPYIGQYEPQHDYLYYEPEIEEVFVYQIYERSTIV